MFMLSELSMLRSIILVDPTASITAKPGANLLAVSVPEGKREIGVSQIRELTRWLEQYGFEAGSKQGIVLCAENMTDEAANALLKNLEEPVADTDIILTTDNPASLLPTIRSRCAVVNVMDVSAEQLGAWGLEVGENAIFEPPMSFVEFLNLSELERWKLSEQWLKSKQNLPSIINTWQNEVVAMPVSQNPIQRAQLAKILAEIQSDLRYNVLPRLAFDKLLLALERSEIID
jgi:DNA polymerase III delta prime subunit